MKRDPFTLLKRSPVKKRRTKPRRGPWRSKPYRHWIARHASILSPLAAPEITAVDPISDPCHTRNNGTSSKGPDFTCVPLTHAEHLEYDAGRKAFERKHGVVMEEIWPRYYNYWIQKNRKKAGLPVPEPSEKIDL